MLRETTTPANAGDRYTGIRKLWGRVIQRAIYDWVAWRDSSKLEKRKTADMAEAWLFRPSESFNGFENICLMLDIDPEKVRARARQFTKEDVLKAEHVERSRRDRTEELVEESTILDE